MERGPSNPGSGGGMKYLVAVVIVAVAAIAMIGAVLLSSSGNLPTVDAVIVSQDCDGLRALMNAPEVIPTTNEQNGELAALALKCEFQKLDDFLGSSMADQMFEDLLGAMDDP